MGGGAFPGVKGMTVPFFWEDSSSCLAAARHSANLLVTTEPAVARKFWIGLPTAMQKIRTKQCNQNYRTVLII